MEFRELVKEDKPLLDEYFHQRYYENSHFTFINLFVWRKPFEVQLAVEDGILYVMSRWQGEMQAMQPFCPAERMADGIRRQIMWFRDRGFPLTVVDVDSTAADAYREYASSLQIVPKRREYDYLYEAKDLINLSGRKYHAKKNHLNHFWRTYPNAEYLTLDRELAAPCSDFARAWARQYAAEYPDDPLVLPEAEAIGEILADYDYYGLKGAAIRVGGEIAAFTLGEALNSDTAVIHVEKASPDFSGAYAAINQGFAEHEWQAMRYINREEDMDIEGLRQAKESYKPVRLIEKFVVSGQ